ncbi:MAG: hypothetical protein ACRD0K_01900 [Egibacteraceae bacterium]
MVAWSLGRLAASQPPHRQESSGDRVDLRLSGPQRGLRGRAGLDDGEKHVALDALRDPVGGGDGPGRWGRSAA